MISFPILAIGFVVLVWMLNAINRQMDQIGQQLDVLRSDLSKMKVRLEATETMANELRRTEILRNHY